MKDFFKGVRKHIGRLDAGQLREQYELIADEYEFFDKIFKTIDRGIIALDEKGEIIFNNESAQTLLGMAPEDTLSSLSLPLGRASKREIAIDYPEPRQLELQTVPMKNGTLVLVRDITAERERTEEELRAGASQAVRELASGVAHEIGNPLNAISLNLQLMERLENKDPELITACREQITRLDGIIRGFLAALRPSKPNLLPGSVAEPLKHCLTALKTQIEERQIAVTLNIPSALPMVALDGDQMEQVFFNLIKNSIEAITDGGTINITIDSNDNEVKIAIRDSGAGMSTEQVSHLFEPYRTGKTNGNGLGLMISSRIVRDHGGTIAAESAIGEGTMFTIALPRIEKRIRALK